MVKLATAAALMSAFIVSGCGGTPVPGSPSAAPSAPSTTSPLVTALPSPSAAATLFRSPLTIAIAGDPNWVAVGGVATDGHLDIVSANQDGTVSLLLGSGSGTFDHAADLPGGKGPAAIAAADLNGDGRLDIVLTHPAVTDLGTGANDVVVLLAKGDATFERLARPAGANPQAVIVADFNGDLKPDLATANNGDHLSIFLGRGDGTFHDPKNAPIGAAFSSGLAAADLNGDGSLDVVTANSLIGHGLSTNTLSVLLGRGDGTFEAPAVYRVRGFQPVLPVVADLNGDGAADIATPNGGGATDVSVLLGRGDGGFSPEIQYSTGVNPHSLVAADLDGDGHLDLAAGGTEGISILFGTGDGTFEPKVDLENGDSTGMGPAADLDGDGRIDLIVLGDHAITLLFNAVAR